MLLKTIRILPAGSNLQIWYSTLKGIYSTNGLVIRDNSICCKSSDRNYYRDGEHNFYIKEYTCIHDGFIICTTCFVVRINCNCIKDSVIYNLKKPMLFHLLLKITESQSFS